MSEQKELVGMYLVVQLSGQDEIRVCVGAGETALRIESQLNGTDNKGNVTGHKVYFTECSDEFNAMALAQSEDATATLILDVTVDQMKALRRCLDIAIEFSE